MTDRQTLHFLACGHVDDGKSTLIGRLLHDIGAVPADQLKGAEVGGTLDFSRLTDGLEDERAQGITIDVAYRYFRYKGRAYRIADTPGHVQYTRNMAVAAANSDCALILVDAVHGVREQTVRHSRIASFFGIKDFVVAVNKMDLVNFSAARFSEVEKNWREAFGAAPGLRIAFIPVSAIGGDNITAKSARTPWYKGPALIDHLAALEVTPQAASGARLPVQSVIRLDETTRGYQGMLADGALRKGDQLAVAGTDIPVTITGLYHSGRAVEDVRPGQAITLVADKDVDLARGSVLYALSAPATCSDRFAAQLLWLDPACERQDSVACVLKIHNREEQAEVCVDPAGGGPILDATVSTASPVPVDLYARHRATGLFILIEPENERVIGVGVVASTAADKRPTKSQAALF